MKINILSGFLASTLFILGVWLTGVDFNERGPDAAAVYFYALILFVVGYLFSKYLRDDL